MKTVQRIYSRVCFAVALGLSVSSAGSVLAGDSGRAPTPAATGCPAWGNPGGNPGLRFMGVMSPIEAVAQWSAQITDAWYAQNGYDKDEFLAARLELATSLDTNGDGLLCVAQNWGENLNPNSHWALIWADTLVPSATEAWFLSDNHVGTSKN